MFSKHPHVCGAAGISLLRVMLDKLADDVIDGFSQVMSHDLCALPGNVRLLGVNSKGSAIATLQQTSGLASRGVPHCISHPSEEAGGVWRGQGLHGRGRDQPARVPAWRSCPWKPTRSVPMVQLMPSGWLIWRYFPGLNLLHISTKAFPHPCLLVTCRWSIVSSSLIFSTCASLAMEMRSTWCLQRGRDIMEDTPAVGRQDGRGERKGAQHLGAELEPSCF